MNSVSPALPPGCPHSRLSPNANSGSWSVRPLTHLARTGPQIDPGLDRLCVYGCELEVGKRRGRGGGKVLFKLPDAARSNQRRSHPRITQNPGNGKLRERLPAGDRQLIQFAHVSEVGLSQLVSRE